MWPPASEWRSPEPKPPIDLEELLGGRVLGWVGGIAVAIAAIFFVVMAVRNGWIGEAARMELAFAASTALIAFGVWLYDRRGQTQAALATVAAGIAALFASTAATTLHYHLISPVLGLVIAGLVGAFALVTAVRWNSQEIAGIGIVGALLAPVLVGCGTSTSSLVFMTIALLASIGVVVYRRWAWLAAAAYVVSAPQAAAWLYAEHDNRLWLTLVVATAFWLLYVVAALGYELRTPTESLRLSSASLLLVNASVAAAGVWWLIDDAGHRSGANAWLFGLAGAHVVLGTLVLGSRMSREIGLLLYAVAAALVGVAIPVTLGGPAVVAAWSAEALVLAWAGRRTDTPERGLVASLVFAGLALGHVLVFEVPPNSLAYGLHSIPVAIGAVALVLVALAGIAAAVPRVRGAPRVGRRRARRLRGERPARRSGRRAVPAVDADVAARALGLLGRARLRGDRRRAARAQAGAPARRPRCPGARGGQGVPRGSGAPRVDLARGLVPRHRPAAARGRVRVSAGSSTVAA